mgnify:CR=1 FL=1
MRRVTFCALALATLAAAPAAALTIDFSSAEGGAKTQVSFSGSNTVAFASTTNTIVSNFNLDFDLVDYDAIPGGFSGIALYLEEYTDIGGLTATGSQTGGWEVGTFQVADDETGSGDEILINLTSPDKFKKTNKDESLTFGGSVTVDLPFATFVSGGVVSPNSFLEGDVIVTIGAAPDMGVVPLPTTGLLLAGAVAGLGALRRRR